MPGDIPRGGKPTTNSHHLGNLMGTIQSLPQQVRRTPDKIIKRLLFCRPGFSSSSIFSFRLLWRLCPLLLRSSETMNINKEGHQGNVRVSWALSTLSVAFITTKQLEIWQKLRFTVWMARMTSGDGKCLTFSFSVSDQRINISGYAKSEVSLKSVLKYDFNMVLFFSKYFKIFIQNACIWSVGRLLNVIDWDSLWHKHPNHNTTSWECCFYYFWHYLNLSQGFTS